MEHFCYKYFTFLTFFFLALLFFHQNYCCYVSGALTCRVNTASSWTISCSPAGPSSSAGKCCKITAPSASAPFARTASSPTSPSSASPTRINFQTFGSPTRARKPCTPCGTRNRSRCCPWRVASRTLSRFNASKRRVFVWMTKMSWRRSVRRER